MPSARPEPSRAPRAVRWPIQVIGTLVLALFGSILLEWVGMTLWWPEQGAAHSAQVFAQERSYLWSAAVTVPPNDQHAAALASAGVQSLWASAWAWMRPWVARLRQSRFARAIATSSVAAYASAAVSTTAVFGVRLMLIVSSLPLFALLALVGLSSGLTLRDRRRWSGGREFGGVYHLTKRGSPAVVGLVLLIYLALPVAVHPNLVLVPAAIAVGLAVTVVTASFKKYL